MKFIYSYEIRKNKIRKGKTVFFSNIHDRAVVSRREGEDVHLEDGRAVKINDIHGQFVSYGWKGKEIENWK